MSATTRATASEIVRIVLQYGPDKRDVCTTIVKLECDRLIEVGRQRGLEEARIALRRVA
jgi:hypothetical protein